MNTPKKLPFLLLLFGLYSFTYNNDPNTLLTKGIHNIANEEYLQAISDLTMAISIQNDLGEAYYHRAISKELFGKEQGFYNSGFCLDYIQAMKYNYTPAIEKIYESGRSECFLLKSASLMSEKAFCIDISSQNIKSISGEFSEFGNLISLNASNNTINDLGTIYNSCPFIVSLDLGNNTISYLPNEIGNLQYIYELNLSNNQIENLPSSFSQLKQIAFLNLRGNNLSNLPKDFNELENIKLLDLSLNNIKKLPKSIYKMDHIETLVLSGNPISKNDIKKLRIELPETDIIFDL